MSGGRQPRGLSRWTGPVSLSGSVCLDRLHLSRSGHVSGYLVRGPSSALDLQDFEAERPVGPRLFLCGPEYFRLDLGVVPSVPCHGFWHAG